MNQSCDEITRLLLAHHEGDEEAFRQLTSLVYDDLRRIALRQIARGGAGETLNATALVHEAYMRLIDETRVEWQGRSHFFAIAARSMRRIIIDHPGSAGRRSVAAASPTWRSIRSGSPSSSRPTPSSPWTRHSPR